MKKLTVLFVVLSTLLSSRANCQEQNSVLPILIIGEKGYAWVINDQEGLPSLFRFSQVITIGKTSTPPPIIVVPPPVTSEFGLDTQAKQWMLTVPDANKANSKEIAKAIRDTVDAAKANKFNTIQEMEAALGISLSGAIVNKSAWAAFGASFQTSITTFKSAGKIKSVDDLTRALTEVTKGL